MKEEDIAKNIRVPIMVTMLFLMAFLFYAQKESIVSFDSFLITRVTIMAAFSIILLGYTLKFLSGNEHIGAFLDAALYSVGIAIVSYLSSYVYTGILASVNARDHVVKKAGFLMQAFMYVVLTCLVYYFLLKKPKE